MEMYTGSKFQGGIFKFFGNDHIDREGVVHIHIQSLQSLEKSPK